MEFGSSIGINLLSTVIWIALGAIGFKSLQIFRKRRASAFTRLTGISHDAKKIHLVYGLVDARRNGTHFSVDEGDVCALCLSLSFLEEKFDPQKVLVINSQAALPNLGTYTDVVSISGPVWNDITSHFLNTLEPPAQFTEVENEDAALVDALKVHSDGQDLFYRTAYNDELPRECYAIVVCGKVPAKWGDREATNSVVAAGVSALGTYGAVWWMKNISTSPPQSLSSQLYDSSKIKTIVLKIRDNSPKGFRTYAADNSTPGYLTVDVLHELVQ